jgi:hypothetical protein
MTLEPLPLDQIGKTYEKQDRTRSNANEIASAPDLYDELAGPEDAPRQSVAVEGGSPCRVAKVHRAGLRRRG